MDLRFDRVQARHPAARAGAPAALRSVSFTLGTGEQVAVIGPSGAGKTTLLQVAALALKPDAGAVALAGQAPWSAASSTLQGLRRRLVLAPQVPPLPPRQRVVTSVLAARLPAWGLLESLRQWVAPKDLPDAARALARFDVEDKLFDRVDRLSGGERQRVGLARVLMAPATLWLVDEPLSALDPTRARQAARSLCDAAHERGATLLASLHHVELALECFPRILGLRDGQLMFDRPSAEVDRALLATLYAQHEDQLAGAPPRTDWAEAQAAQPAPPAVMHCR